MTSFLEISRCAHDMYHNMQDDDIMKNIFNSGRHKDKVGMQIPDWMITEEMKHTEHYRMYAEVFGLDVPLTQSQPTESTQGTHRTPSAPRSPNPKMDAAESSALKWSTVIHFRLPERKSTRLTPPAPVPTVDIKHLDFGGGKTSYNGHITSKSCLLSTKREEQLKPGNNGRIWFNKRLASKEIEKMVEGSENVIDDSLHPRNDEPNIHGTRLEPRSDKESSKVEITNDKEVEITNVVIPVNVNEEEDEITDEVYKLKRREKGKIVEESRNTQFPTPIRSPRTHTNLVFLDTKKLQELTVTNTQTTSSSRSPNTKLSKTNRLISLFKPNLLGFNHTRIFYRSFSGRYIFGWTSQREIFVIEVIVIRLVDHRYHKLHVDLLPFALEIRKILMMMLIQRGIIMQSGRRHLSMKHMCLESHHLDKSMKRNEKENFSVSPTLQKTTPLVQCFKERDPEASTLSLVNQDLLYLKEKKFRAEKIVLSLTSFCIIFKDDDIEEQTSRWVRISRKGQNRAQDWRE
ncbi:hypothetical protein Tco_0653595 [Tanacetum coccineum]|uniref:Uncharacterized protein n=1 Tax=Tanacetum coccineum TaxID=301880 RepID=A0ABQ4X0V4_9ASTR